MIQPVASAFHLILAPLARAVTDPVELQLLLARAGYEVPELDQAMADDVAAAFGLDSEFGVIADYGGSTDLDDLLDLIDAAASVYRTIVDVVAGDATFDVTSLPAPLDDPERFPAVLRDVLDVLVSGYVADTAAPINSLLRLVGIRPSARPGPIYWGDIPSLFDAPGESLADVYGWGAKLDVVQIDNAVGAVADLLPLPIERREPRDALVDAYWPHGVAHGTSEFVLTFAEVTGDAGDTGEFGLVVLPVPDLTTATPGSAAERATGVLLAPMSAAGADHDLDLGNGWRLRLSADADLTGVVGVALLPSPAVGDGPDGIRLETTTGAGDFTMGVALVGHPPTPGAWSIGGDIGPRLDLLGVEVAFGISGPANALEPDASIALRATDGGPGIAVSLSDPEADGFMGWILGGGASIDIDVEIEVSPSGIRLVGGLGLEISIPIDKQYGPLYLAKADVGLTVDVGDAAGLRLEGTATGNLAIGPLVLVADGIGAALVVEAAPDADGLLGPADLRLEFVPPTAFGASFDSDLVSGGGYIEITPPRYSGILDLQVLAVGITVVGVVDAKTPDAPAGTPDFSLYLSIVTEFTPIPLAFGFTLNGVGGIVAFNRTMDTDALVDGLFAGDLDHILYPDDPIADAPQILESIDAFFPVQDGATTFGPVVRIGWGIPVTIVTIDVGVLITFPEVAIVLIGKLHIALPDDEIPLLELNAQVLGIVEFAGPSILVVASIQDSQVLGIRLSGDFGTYLDMGSKPFFMFSVGGTHPDWVAPAGVPAALTDLEPLGASISLADNVSIGVWGYLAVTSNTVQFGGGLHFEASTKFLGTTYSAVGVFEVNVLIVFNPFRIQAGLRASCEVRTARRTLMGVWFTADFEGPDPWFASGGAEFDFFGIKVNFPVEVGSRARTEIAPPIDVGAELAAALAHPDAWSTVPATDGGSTDGEISWLTFDADAAAPVRPGDAIELRQTVVPLNTTIEKYGTGVPSGADRFTVGSVRLGGRSVTADIVTDTFAPALFFELTDADRLSSASFVDYDAGVSFGAGADVDAQHETVVSIAHEQRIVGQVGGTPKLTKVPLPADRIRERSTASVRVTGTTLKVVT